MFRHTSGLHLAVATALLTLLVACTSTVSLEDACIDFENEPLGALSNPPPYGIELDPIGTGPGVATVKDTDHTDTSALKEVLLGNTAMVFNFDKTYPGVTFNYADLGGSVYLSVNGLAWNGQDMHELNSVSPPPYAPAGVKVDRPSDDVNYGRVTLSGGINSLEVGGQELVVTYFCKAP